MNHRPNEALWPFRERRVPAERLRREGLTPDPAWHYDRATDTYGPPVLRDDSQPPSRPIKEA